MCLSDKVITIHDEEEDDRNDMIEWELVKKLLDEGKESEESSSSAKATFIVTVTGKEKAKMKGKAKRMGKAKVTGKVKAKTDGEVDSNEDD